jgi:transcriptional regulator with XRE-family HTH domain
MTLREYLDARKLSQAAFAEKVGVSPTEVSLWLAGKRRPNLAHAFAVEDATEGEVAARYLLALGGGKRRPKKSVRRRRRLAAPRRAAAREIHDHE